MKKMKPELMLMQSLLDHDTKLPSQKVIETIDSLEELFQQRAKIENELRCRMRLWKALAQLGISLKAPVRMERRHQVRPELVTHLTFEPRVLHRDFQKVNYSAQNTYITTRDGSRTGILESDKDDWLKEHNVTMDDIFCFIYGQKAQSHEPVIQFVIWKKMVGRPVNEIALPRPFTYGRTV